MVTGIVTKGNATGLTLIGLGAALLLAAVVLPAITQVEYGFPSGVKVVAARRDREENLRRVFADQRPDLELCAKLLCDDPATASELLTAAIARATLGWRGPVDAQIRVYVLCWFVHRLMAHSRLAAAQPSATTDGANRLLVELTQIQRVLYGVVLAVLPSLGHLSANTTHADQFGFAQAATETPQPITNILSTPLVVDGKSIAPGQIVYPGFDADVLWNHPSTPMRVKNMPLRTCFERLTEWDGDDVPLVFAAQPVAGLDHNRFGLWCAH